VRWPARGLAALSAGLAVGWVVSRGAAPPPLAPPIAGLAAAGLVAALPRVGWLLATAGVSALLTAQGRPGEALLVLLVALLPVVPLAWRRGSWSLAAGAPGLGAIGLAGGWPALAARAGGVWSRFCLGAIGWIWILAVGLLAGRGLYTRLPAQLPAGWEGSIVLTTTHVLPRVFAPALIAPAVLWGFAAIILPWSRVSHLPVQIVLVTAWSAALASATATALRLLHAEAQIRPGVAALGAVLAWVLALVPEVVRTRERASQSADTATGLA
jgi:hypothetical protein